MVTEFEKLELIQNEYTGRYGKKRSNTGDGGRDGPGLGSLFSEQGAPDRSAGDDCGARDVTVAKVDQVPNNPTILRVTASFLIDCNVCGDTYKVASFDAFIDTSGKSVLDPSTISRAVKSLTFCDWKHNKHPGTSSTQFTITNAIKRRIVSNAYAEINSSKNWSKLCSKI